MSPIMKELLKTENLKVMTIPPGYAIRDNNEIKYLSTKDYVEMISQSHNAEHLAMLIVCWFYGSEKLQEGAVGLWGTA